MVHGRGIAALHVHSHFDNDHLSCQTLEGPVACLVFKAYVCVRCSVLSEAVGFFKGTVQEAKQMIRAQAARQEAPAAAEELARPRDKENPSHPLTPLLFEDIPDDDDSSESTTSGFRDQLVEAYSQKMPHGHLFCMLSHTYLPQEYVIAAHLLPRRLSE